MKQCAIQCMQPVEPETLLALGHAVHHFYMHPGMSPCSSNHLCPCRPMQLNLSACMASHPGSPAHTQSLPSIMPQTPMRTHIPACMQTHTRLHPRMHANPTSHHLHACTLVSLRSPTVLSAALHSRSFAASASCSRRALAAASEAADEALPDEALAADVPCAPPWFCDESTPAAD